MKCVRVIMQRLCSTCVTGTKEVHLYVYAMIEIGSTAILDLLKEAHVSFPIGLILLIHTCGLIGYAAFCQVYCHKTHLCSCTKHFMSSLRMYSLALVALACTVQK